MTRNLDLLQECNDQKVPVADFKAAFCSRCRNTQCVNARGSESRWIQRIGTQEERLLIHPNFADDRDPRFDSIRGLHFRSLGQEEIVLNSRDPWAGPGVHMASPDTKTHRSDAVDQAVAALVGKPVLPTRVESQPPPVLTPTPKPQPSTPVTSGLAMNVPFEESGVMLDGTPPKSTEKSVSVVDDPWAPPPPKPMVVPVGAKIRLGG